MTRFKITNQKTGIQFQFEADEFPKEMQPEWGPDPIVKVESKVTQVARKSRDTLRPRFGARQIVEIYFVALLAMATFSFFLPFFFSP